MTLLEIDTLTVNHGLLQAVRGISFMIDKGQTVALVGANGAGKSSALRSIAGAHRPSAGRVLVDGNDVTDKPAHRRVAEGLALVPEGRRLFPEMTIRENLKVAGGRSREGNWNVDSVLDAFPMLGPIIDKRAGQLSGGQQQAAAIGRALMTNPRVLLIDELSLGLAPIAVDAVYESVSTLISSGATVLLVEQDLSRALSVADRVLCMLEGRIVMEAPTADVTRDEVTAAYFGVPAETTNLGETS